MGGSSVAMTFAHFLAGTISFLHALCEYETGPGTVEQQHQHQHQHELFVLFCVCLVAGLEAVRADWTCQEAASGEIQKCERFEGTSGGRVDQDVLNMLNRV